MSARWGMLGTAPEPVSLISPSPSAPALEAGGGFQRLSSYFKRSLRCTSASRRSPSAVRNFRPLRATTTRQPCLSSSTTASDVRAPRLPESNNSSEMSQLKSTLLAPELRKPQQLDIERFTYFADRRKNRLCSTVEIRVGKPTSLISVSSGRSWDGAPCITSPSPSARWSSFYLHPSSRVRRPAMPHLAIARSPFSILSMQPSTKDAKSRFTTFSMPAFSVQNL